MNKRLLAFGFAILAASACASSAEAQRIPIGSVSGGRHFAHSYRTRGFNAGSAFLPGYYSDQGGVPMMIELPPPPIIQVAPPAAAAPPAPPTESLILELQGDHWVRLTHGGLLQTVSGNVSTPDSSAPAARRAETVAPSAPLPAAVLVFRDGHQEEITRYTISGATIVAPVDYWTTGSWTRKILIAGLNVPETLRLNQQRGAQFKLPSGPHEVVVRP
jgi:hypothetical protein